jgi:hypothetical protein
MALLTELTGLSYNIEPNASNYQLAPIIKQAGLFFPLMPLSP